jgi:hypothetical protein
LRLFSSARVTALSTVFETLRADEAAAGEASVGAELSPPRAEGRASVGAAELATSDAREEAEAGKAAMVAGSADG